MGWSNNFPVLFARQNEQRLAERALKIEAYLFDSIYTHSPVDTGRFRANHNRSVDEPDFTFGWDKESGKAKPPKPKGRFFTLWIANGAPYGPRIEHHAWSHKAAGGVFELAMTSAKARFSL